MGILYVNFVWVDRSIKFDPLVFIRVLTIFLFRGILLKTKNEKLVQATAEMGQYETRLSNNM